MQSEEKKRKSEKTKKKWSDYYSKNREERIKYCSDWRKRNSERVNSLRRMHRENFLEKALYKACKGRASKDNLPFDLAVEDVVIPEKCPIFGVPLVTKTDYAPTIDRKIPSLGYTKSNIWVISHKANTMKNKATLEQLKTFCNSILELQELQKGA